MHLVEVEANQGQGEVDSEVGSGANHWKDQVGSGSSCLQVEVVFVANWSFLEEKTGQDYWMALEECESQVPQLLNWQWEAGIQKECL